MLLPPVYILSAKSPVMVLRVEALDNQTMNLLITLGLVTLREISEKAWLSACLMTAHRLTERSVCWGSSLPYTESSAFLTLDFITMNKHNLTVYESTSLQYFCNNTPGHKASGPASLGHNCSALPLQYLSFTDNMNKWKRFSFNKTMHK